VLELAGARDFASPFISVLVTTGDFALNLNNLSYAAAASPTAGPEPGTLITGNSYLASLLLRGSMRYNSSMSRIWIL
jgi:hypothetical protein